MTTLVIATRNAHKVGEIRAVLGTAFFCHTLTEFPGAPQVVEDAGTFAGNATKKAVELARWLCSQAANESFGLGAAHAYTLADDSGLEVDALHGAPGVHSARFAALDSGQPGNSTDAENNAKLLRLLGELPIEKRTARFRCVIALTPLTVQTKGAASPPCAADELELQTEIFDGVCEGRIAFAPSGKGGFGYDPLFIPIGFTESFAELGEEIKNTMSHRAHALQKLCTWFARPRSR